MKSLISFLGVILLISCQGDDYTTLNESSLIDQRLEKVLLDVSGGKGNSFFTLPESTDLNAIPQDPKNPLTREKIALGKLLLHDPATGGNPKNSENKGKYSCASCHAAASGFSSGKVQGIGEGGIGFGIFGEGRFLDPTMDEEMVDVQPFRSPNLLNLAYQDVMLWNGKFGGTGTNKGTEAQWDNIPENKMGFEGVEVQAMQGIKVHRIKIDQDFVQNYGYNALFDEAFPDLSEEERYSDYAAALAIAAFERTLLANKAPWQKYLKGDENAMSNAQKRGATLFFSSAKCYECHNGPALKDKEFYAWGMADINEGPEKIIVQAGMNLDDVALGRGGFTKNPADNYKFKTPTLYNLADNPVYGHGGSFKSIKEVITYKNNGRPQKTQVPASQFASQFGNINLTDSEIDDLTEFVSKALRDPDLKRYEPNVLKSGMCFPNNDLESRKDCGCD
ncbi:cytochrome-c peroxidase [Flavimarina sp. Hel_I_48]|uniref:cytochrome-c peroxidase n=1 Tax=Flavimarina sp. Hel_I_48 TaxID=1392488 RepID=UPI0004DF8E32|nr:cytochrome c peroxidase [Flavimarina sp. Hel_I_48]